MSLFLQALNGEFKERPPIWMMRQAGRALKSYQLMREKYFFETMMREPELAAKVTLMPVHELGVDAAILFSDILVVPQALGMQLHWTEKGPRFAQALKEFEDPAQSLADDFDFLSPIFAAIKLIEEQRPKEVPLIGFCGAPLTVMAYMYEGLGSDKGFPDLVQFFYSQPEKADALLEKIIDVSIRYAKEQIRSGVAAFQIFETWGNLLPWTFYKDKILPSVYKLAKAVQKENIPVIYFPRGIGLGLSDLKDGPFNGIGIDWQTPMPQARSLVGEKMALQGNLDPRLLLAEKSLDQGLKELLDFGRQKTPWIFNLGHGVLPNTKQENLKKAVDWVKTQNWK